MAKVAGGDAVPNHPVVSLLPRVVGDSRTRKFLLNKVVQAKLELVEKPLRVCKTLESVEENAEGTYSSLYYLMLESSGARQPEVLDAASHMGKGVGLALLLKSIPQDALKDKVDELDARLGKKMEDIEALRRDQQTTQEEPSEPTQ